MEASGVALRPLPHCSGAGFRSCSDAQSKDPSLSSLAAVTGNRLPGKLSVSGSSRANSILRRSSKFSWSSEFHDDGHLGFYDVVAPRCGKKKEMGKEKVKDPGAAALKKRIKMIKGLSKDLMMLSAAGPYAVISEDLTGESKQKIFSDAAEALLAQLKELRAEEKEMKRIKEDKAVLKAARKKSMAKCDTSSSSLESIDRECKEEVDMRCQRSVPLAEPKFEQPLPVQLDVPITSPSTSSQVNNIAPSPSDQGRKTIVANECHEFSICGSACSSSSSKENVVGDSVQRIEVCMGGKCKKSGAAAILEEFEKMVAVDGAVVGCKCMGKCRDGPNVRVLNHCSDKNAVEQEGSVRPVPNSLCIGVSLEDVGSIVTNFFGEKYMGLLVAS